MNCKICLSLTSRQFQAEILNKYIVSYYLCPNCSFLQTENPYWLEEAYLQPINDSDTGIMYRNLWLRNIASTIIFFIFEQKKIFLDFGGGYGIFVRMMRDSGFNFYWLDKHTENLFAKGFEFSNGSEKIEMLTCFETFEHFDDRINDLEKVLNYSKNILFSTELIPEPVPQPDDWWYYGLDHGQHISFFQRRTFEFLAKKYEIYFYSNGKNIHLLSVKKISPFMFNFFVKTSNYFSPFIRKRMQPLTWKDWENILEKKA